MIPKECKRLAEVDFPIAVVSKHSAREKSIRHGHPSTLHLWWARRPLAACRAMLMALLLPDPADPHCPEQFKIEARKLLAPLPVPLEPDDAGLRRALLKFIGDFSNWNFSNNRLYVEAASSLVKAAHDEEAPLVVDPFAGGGSIPLEALRLGCEVFASDLNPIACMVLKVMLEDIPRFGPEFGEQIRAFGKKIKIRLEHELGHLYPTSSDGSMPTAYLWARTVKCESPNCGAEVPIYRSGWLAKRGAKRARYFKEADDGSCYALIIDSAPKGGPIKFRIARGHGSENAKPGYFLLTGTKAAGRTASVVCPCCGGILPGTSQNNRTAFQLSAQRGGSDVVFDSSGKRHGGAYLLAVVVQNRNGKGLTYRLPTRHDYTAPYLASQELEKLRKESPHKGVSVIPEEPLPLMSGTFNVPIYGIRRWGDIFTARQNVALCTLARIISEIEDSQIQELMAMVLGRCADYWSSGVVWAQGGEFVAHTFGRQALPMIWDFAEANPLGQTSGNFLGAVDWVARVVEAWPSRSGGTAQVQQEDARESPLPDQSANIWFTDPPYYFAVPYADLSDFFFVWMKRALPKHNLLKDRFDPNNLLTPKDREICEMAHWDSERYAHKDKSFFEEGMRAAFVEGRRLLNNDGIGCVVFAHKTTEGWEALLSGMIRGGWVITGSWPIATERPGRLRSQDSAALATSVHLVCRPRPEDAPIGDWTNVIKELPERVGDWMERLQKEGIRGADLVFACIGPALEIYSRYLKVVDVEDREIPLGGDLMATEPYKRGYLAYVWEAVGKAALEQVLGTAEAKARNSAAGALEEDARLTALFLWALQSTNGNGAKVNGKGVEEEIDEDEEGLAPQRKKGGFNLIFDVVRRFAQPLGIRLPDWEGRIIETNKGVVRLLPVKERAKQLFGDTGAQAVADQLEKSAAREVQLRLFPVEAGGFVPKIRGRGGKHLTRVGVDISDDDLRSRKEATTLDRVHAAMLLQANGRANALRALLKAEVERGPDFLRLANALSALYPKVSEEKRLLDAMLLAVPK